MAAPMAQHARPKKRIEACRNFIVHEPPGTMAGGNWNGQYSMRKRGCSDMGDLVDLVRLVSFTEFQVGADESRRSTKVERNGREPQRSHAGGDDRRGISTWS